MNVLKPEKQAAIIRALMEGNSIRSVERLLSVHRDTVLKLLGKTDERCREIHDQQVRNCHLLYCEADESWMFAGRKQGRLSEEEKTNPELGDQYIWIGLDPESRLIVSYLVGKRDGIHAVRFMLDLKSRLNGHDRFQITTDGVNQYVDAVNWAFGRDVNFAQLVKMYKAQHPEPGRYAPPKISGMVSTVICGNPDPAHISTSLVERHNLSMRTCLRRMTRLSFCYTKKAANLRAAIDIYMVFYNFVRPHASLGGVTPGMEAQLTDHIWEIEELLPCSK